MSVQLLEQESRETSWSVKTREVVRFNLEILKVAQLPTESDLQDLNVLETVFAVVFVQDTIAVVSPLELLLTLQVPLFQPTQAPLQVSPICPP